MHLDKDVVWSDQSYDPAAFDFSLDQYSDLHDTLEPTTTQSPFGSNPVLDSGIDPEHFGDKETRSRRLDLLSNDMLRIMQSETVINKSTYLPTPVPDPANGPFADLYPSQDPCGGTTEYRALGLPLSTLPSPDVTIDEQANWEYYAKTIVPCMLLFVPQDVEDSMRTNALESCSNSSLCMRQLASKIDAHRASELKRFGLTGLTDRVSGQESRTLATPRGYGSCSPECVLHTLFAQVSKFGVHKNQQVLTV